ncbi:ABC transporter ATP-binding protein [Priestia endophytica]|uniref:Sodium ABC transporter ATP-binding protein n=1 Tax=Priestia endophytica TaxID=135735 RepID=A0AAX1QE02_9BACI|nr:ABC transporter ATP-binding protein [Priestia endophytica]RAS82087.1 sodium ABC transporter ATP-binding protein [Priestia endophytica]RAS84550.1 sodium ABC transporter ATP-binding protein [Priestia endophytica]
MKNVIELKNINKTYKEFKIENLSLNVKRGFVTGFIGANGAGKSTTIKLIMNLIKSDSGSISVFGKDYKSHEREIKQKIGFVFDENVFYERWNLKQIKRFISKAYKNWLDKTFYEYVELFELPLNVKIKNFSKGMKMKASLALALSHKAELIIMDEPTSGLDPVVRREILDILYDLMQDEQKTIFFSSHITTDLDRIADYITFIHKGKLIFSEDVHSIAENYAIIKGETNLLDQDVEKELVGVRKTYTGFEGLTSNSQKARLLFGDSVLFERPSLDDIMYFTGKGSIHG